MAKYIKLIAKIIWIVLYTLGVISIHKIILSDFPEYKIVWIIIVVLASISMVFELISEIKTKKQ